MVNVGLGYAASDLQLALLGVFPPKISSLVLFPSIHMMCSFVESDRWRRMTILEDEIAVAL